MVDAVTSNYKLWLPEFDKRGWQNRFYDNMRVIDAAITQIASISAFQGVWTNSTDYAVGDKVVDTDSSTIFECAVAHTSDASPTTFAEGRAAHGTYWINYTVPSNFRGAWVADTAYRVGDWVVDGHKYAVCVVAHTSSDFDNDVAASKWVVTADLTSDVDDAAASAASALSSAAAAAVSASAALVSQASAATSATSAATSAAAAAVSAASAQVSQVSAAASAVSANASVTSAAISATSAAASATSAAASVTSAAASVTSAAASATSAAASATSAAASATSAAASAGSVYVSTFDTTLGRLATKLVAGTLLTITKNNSGGNETLAFDADPDIILSDTTKNLTAGYTATSPDQGTKSSGTFTPDATVGNFQHYTNGGAHTLAPPSSTCSMIIDITNNGSAGAVTTSGFTKVTGDTLTTTNGHKFRFFITVGNAGSHLHKQAMQ